MTSRRGFLGAGARFMAGSWALAASPFRALPHAEPPGGTPLAFIPPLPDNSGDHRPKRWSPIEQAMDRFRRHEDRFECERRFRALQAAFEQLGSSLRAAGAGLEKLLSPGFSGSRLRPQNESVLRDDVAFRVSQWTWDDREPAARLRPAEFSANLARWLEPHAPLGLADLECLAIAESGDGTSGRLRTRVRFELEGSAGPPETAGSFRFARWQAVGQWEIEWEPVKLESGGPIAADAAAWLISTWTPVETVVTLGPERAFTDLTAFAFGADPSYRAHLLRDTNYWRTVLDAASGIDIFGDYGVSAGDADGDGQDEVYLCQPQGLPNRLYRQRAPAVFEDIAAESGVDLLDATSMVLFADILNRGRQDLIAITQSSPLLFLNDGHGRFKLAPNAFPTVTQQAALTGAALGDYDGDGYLDLYICSYGYFQGQGAASIPAPYYDARNGPPNYLYRNRGDGTFEDATERSGLNHGNDRFSFACVWTHLDDQVLPDLVVVNDYGRDQLYHNRGDGTFEEIEDGVPGHGSGMSASAGDFAGDGRAGLYVANMCSGAGNRITSDPAFLALFGEQGEQAEAARQFARGNALYQPTAGQRPLGYQFVPSSGADWARWAYCSDAFDIENDGKPDLYALNGFLSAPNPKPDTLDAYLWQDIIALSPVSPVMGTEYRAAWAAGYEFAHQDHSWDGFQRNALFLNLGNGAFADASAVTGLDFRDDGRSFAVFDFDGDGDADLVIHGRTGPQLRLLRNDVASSNHSLSVRLTASHGNRDAIGARVEIETPSGRVVRWLGAGSGFLAQHSKELVFGLGSLSAGLTARVHWPGGNIESFANLEAGFRYYFTEGQPAPRRERLRPGSTASFAGSPSVHAEPPPDRFSTWLVDPLPLPPLGLAVSTSGTPDSASSNRTLIWLWSSARAGTTGSAALDLDTFLSVQSQMPARLVIWDGELPSSLEARMKAPVLKADDRSRTFLTTVLMYLFDRRRPPVFPTGLLVEDDVGSTTRPNQSGSIRLVKIYWGGADSDEVLKDSHADLPRGAAALPFPGQAHLCSFTRETRALGAALASAGLYAEAEPYLVRAVDANARDSDAAYNLALAARELSKTSLALSSVQTALAGRPHFPEAENLLGVLLMQSGRANEAQTHLEKATGDAPDFVEAWNNLGYLWLSQGNLDASRTAVEKALALAPDFPEALNNLGIIAARQGKPDEAAGLFRKVLAADPENEQAGNNLGVLEAKQGRISEAIETFKSVLEHNPEAASVLLNLARLEISTGHPAEARQMLESWLNRHPNDAAAQQVLDHAKAAAPSSPATP
jgi:tetratricopeptide (TPR) repeat protein